MARRQSGLPLRLKDQAGAAKADLKGIGRYTKQHWGVAQRDTYLTMLDACLQELAAHPSKGLDCSDIRAGYRNYSAGSHVIFYR